MKIKKRVLRKKDIVETEEIQSILYDIYSKGEQFVRKNRLMAVTLFAMLVILSSAIVTYYYLYQKWNKETSTLENSAYNYYLEGNYKEALSRYQEIVKNFPSNKTTPIAIYYIGNSYLGLGQNDEAIHAYQGVIEKNNDNDTILPLVYINLGHAYINKKDYSNAIDAFKKAATVKDSPVADWSVYETARVYEISGDKVSAIERYEYLTKTFPNSPWSQDATAKLNKFRGGPESTVKSPQQGKGGNK